MKALEWLRVTHAGTLSGRRVEEAVEQAYKDGESSGRADYAIALGEVLPDDVDAWSPVSVARYLQERK